MAGFPFDGTWGFGAMVALASGASNDSSRTVGDGGTGSDSNSLAVSNASGVDGSARAVLRWLPLGGESNSARLNRSGARVNGAMQAADF